ncbi:MAG: ATP-binding protein, partial [Candidatus Cloacimonadaceae bacterium]
TAEDFLSELPSVQDLKVLLRLASLHNNLGVCYSNLKNIEEANEHFNIALSIWTRFNIKRYLGLIYNNFADLYLKQGNTPVSESYSHKGYTVAAEQGLNITMALALLNMGEAHIKMGDFQKAIEFLGQSKDIIIKLKSAKFLSSIEVNLALAMSKIKSFGYYYKFISENEPQLNDGIIKEINPLVKTYFYYLYELGLPKQISKLLRKNVQINYHDIHEDEFYYNTLSLVSILNRDYAQAQEHLKNATKFAGEVRNHYALTVFYILEIECCIGLKDYTGAEAIISKAMELAKKYQYRYWYYNLLMFRAVIDLASPVKPLRQILRELISLYDDVEKYEYYLLSSKIRLMIVKNYLAVNAEVEAAEWFDNYKTFLLDITKGVNEEDRPQYLKQNSYSLDNVKKLNLSNIASRYQNTRTQWNELQYSLVNIQNPDRVKFFIEKGLKEIIAPWRFQIMLYSEKQNSYFVYLRDQEHGDYVITPQIYQFIDKAFKADNIITEDFDLAHNMIVPLQIKYHKIGFMIISDHNELAFTKTEITLIKAIRQHITNLIMRIQDYSEITQKMKMMNRLMTITHSLMRVVEIKSLETEIVSACMDFTGASRGFLIKKDEEGNYIYQVAMDYKKSPLSNIAVISKTVISECQYAKTAVYTYNALEDNRFKNSISVHDYKLHSVFCAPLIINEEIYGFIYLDNYLDNTQAMYLNPEITTLLFDQISIALKNALQYESIIQKSQELQSLEALKNEFMAIVSHELNTPLTTLQGYVSRLKRSLFSDEEERQDIMNKIESNLKKLILTTNDIITMNSYNLKSDLPKVALHISDIINLVHHEVEIVSRHRNMFIKVEVSPDLPEIEGNWEAMHLMIYNLVLNSIRFTNDFGTIIIGARRSAFQEEKLNNKDTLVIYVQDNGIGMPEYQLKNVFRKFYELNEIYAHKSGTTEYRSSGLGLGLAVSRRIAELHHGNIWIKSQENEGTTVFVSLPIKLEK